MKEISGEHHAYFFSGKYEEIRGNILKRLEGEDIVLRGNPDLLEKEVISFSIDDARSLQEWALTKAIGKKKIAIIGFQTITSEAQNALLKLLEEPEQDVQFFLIGGSDSILLPTLRSRVLLQRGQEVSNKEKGESFLKASLSDRIKEIERIAKSDDKKKEFLELLNSIEAFGAAHMRKDLEAPLRDLLEMKSYALDRSPSIKMIGEYLAFRLPQI